MDDDILVKDDCLKHLLGCTPAEEYVWPRVIAKDGSKLGLFGWWGVLLSKNLIEKAGYPLTDLFYWIEDTEYLQHRIQRVQKTTPYRCNAAIVHHLHQRTKKRPSWYYYYVVRNTLFYRIYIVPFTWRRLRRTLILIPSFFMRIILKEDDKARKVKLMLYGIYHGVAGKIGKLIDPATNK
jgi:GT2 family glycosyltransferase